MHADDIKNYEGPPCEMCQRSMFIGTCTHRPRRRVQPLSAEDLAALDALKCPTCGLSGMKDGACLFVELHKSSEGRKDGHA